MLIKNKLEKALRSARASLEVEGDEVPDDLVEELRRKFKHLYKERETENIRSSKKNK